MTTTITNITYSAKAHFPQSDDPRLDNAVALTIQHLDGNIIVGASACAIDRTEDRGWIIDRGYTPTRDMLPAEVARCRAIVNQLLEDGDCRIANVSINFATPIED
jgi:hypothetical protein